MATNEAILACLARPAGFDDPGYRAHMVEPGVILAARYRLDEPIGRGGMATVYRAWDTQLDRPVAVKLLRPEILADPDLAIRFRREAHAAAILRHPSIVGYLDAGTDRGQPFLVMELVEGENLAVRLRRESPLPPSTAVQLAADVAKGLAIAHARGIVHRDVKPGNILVDRTGRARITDFGVARIAAEAEATIQGTTLGSVHYFSPEQARGGTTTPASDVYSLGLVLFEMLTGTRPFGGDTSAAVALARIDAPAPSPRAVDPALPAALDAVVTRALAPDPAARYPDAGGFADALERCLTVAVPEAAPADPSDTTTTFTIAPVRPTAVRPTSMGTRSGIAAPVLGLAAALVVAFGGFAALALLGAGGEESPVLAEASNDPAASDVSPPSQVPASDPPSAAPTDPPPTPDPTDPPPTPAPTDPPPTPDPTPEPPPDDPGDLCEPDPGATCALAAGRYTPSQFEPAVSIELDDGWATHRTSGRLVVLARDEGYLTLASGVSVVFDGEDEYEVRSDGNALLDAFRADPALVILDQRRTRVDGQRAVQLDIVPVGDRAPLFGIGEDVYYVEPETVTRVYVFEVRGEPVILALEGANGVDLGGFLDAAGGALSSLSLG